MSPAEGRRAAGPMPETIGRAACLLYFDELRDEQIAATLGVPRRTLARWKRRPDFEAASIAASEVGRRLSQEQARERVRWEASPWRSPARGRRR